MTESPTNHPPLMEVVFTFMRELKFGARSLARTKGLTFTLVRGVQLRPLVNRDESRLIYIRQSSSQVENTYFSVPEIQDLRASVKTLTEVGDFSQIGFTVVGLGEPRELRAGVVGGSYFHVMGLHPVLGRLLGPGDDGPDAKGAVVLTYRFWI